MSVSFQGIRVIIGSGVKLDMNDWDSDLQRVQASAADSHVFNAWLETLEQTANKAFEALEHSGNTINAKNFRELFSRLKPQYSPGFFPLFYQFMESNSSRWSMATYRKVRSIYKLLRDFEEGAAYPMAFDRMDTVFLEKFTAFCSEKAYRPSTIHRAVNILIWFLNWATDNNYNVYREYRQFYKLLAPLQEKAPIPLFLKWEEVMQLREFITDNRRVERVRDLFCFMCFAGVRFSELQQLKKEDVSSTEVIIKRPKGGLRRVPLNKYAREIYLEYEDKYYLNNTAFPGMSIITMNKYLRIMARETGLSRKVRCRGVEGDRVPLYNCLSAGMAVNTFIANALELDVPAEIISGFTGVQNDSRVRRIKLDMAAKEIKKFDRE